MRWLYRFAAELLKVAVVAALLFAGIYNGSSYLGWQETLEAAARGAPLSVVSEEKYQAIVADGVSRKAFRQDSCRFQAGSFSVLGPGNIDQKEWQEKLSAAEHFLAESLGRRPLWMPTLELRAQEGLEGSYDGLNLVVDPSHPEPFRTVFHEMTHLFLFWALFPGLPFDCPRWFNEGCAEWVSGSLSGDHTGRWLNELILEDHIVPFASISPGFSLAESSSDFQARHAFGKFLETFGWPGVRAVLRGLACARPFHAVFQQEFRMGSEVFEEACRQEFRQRYSMSEVSFAEAWKRLDWQIDHQRDQRVYALIRGAMRKWPNEKRLLEGAARLREHQINDCLSLHKPLEAMGWWKLSRDLLPTPADTPLLKKISEAMLKEGSPRGGIPFRNAPSGRISGPFLEFPHEEGIGTSSAGKKTPNPGIFLLWLCVSWVSLWGFRRFRCRLLPFLSGCWTVEFRFSQEIRWLIVLLFSIGCAWFIRLLVIGFIPYAGFDGLPDLQRQFLSESLVSALWVFLGIQLLFWENSEVVQNRKNSVSSPRASEENPSNGARYRNIILGSAALFLVFLLPHIKWPVDTSAVTRALLQLPGLITLSAHAGSVLAQDFLVFSLTRFWSRRKILNLWYPALCYAFLRGWYPIHLSSFILLLVMGRVLCGMVSSLRSFLLPMLVDCFCMLPALIGLAGTWIPLFPAGPFLPTVGGPSWWWAIVILPILWVFPSPQNSGNKHDLV